MTPGTLGNCRHDHTPNLFLGCDAPCPCGARNARRSARPEFRRSAGMPTTTRATKPRHMERYLVMCTVRDPLNGGHRCITHIGGTIRDEEWRVDVLDALSYIANGLCTFYTMDFATGVESEVGVVRESGRVPYLRAQRRGVWNDALLALPACPLVRPMIF